MSELATEVAPAEAAGVDIAAQYAEDVTPDTTGPVVAEPVAPVPSEQAVEEQQVEEQTAVEDLELSEDWQAGYRAALEQAGLVEAPPPKPGEEGFNEWVTETGERLRSETLLMAEEVAARTGQSVDEVMAAAYGQAWDTVGRENAAAAEADHARAVEQAEESAAQDWFLRQTIEQTAAEIGADGVPVDEVIGLARHVRGLVAEQHGEEVADQLAGEILSKATAAIADKIETGSDVAFRTVSPLVKALNPNADPAVALEVAAQALPRELRRHGGDEEAALRAAALEGVRAAAGDGVRADVDLADYYSGLHRAFPSAPPPSPRRPVEMRRNASGHFVAKETPADRYLRELDERRQAAANRERGQQALALASAMTREQYAGRS